MLQERRPVSSGSLPVSDMLERPIEGRTGPFRSLKEPRSRHATLIVRVVICLIVLAIAGTVAWISSRSSGGVVPATHASENVTTPTGFTPMATEPQSDLHAGALTYLEASSATCGGFDTGAIPQSAWVASTLSVYGHG